VTADPGAGDEGSFVPEEDGVQPASAMATMASPATVLDIRSDIRVI
jgi:hypothetical protein